MTHFSDSQSSLSQGNQQQLLVLLQGVARSFYLTVRILPKNVQNPVAIAYLLARAADTIADTDVIVAEKRLAYLLLFRQQIIEPCCVATLRQLSGDLVAKQMSSDERQLLTMLPTVFTAYEGLNASDRGQVYQVLLTLIQGMEFDLNTFPVEHTGHIKALPSEQALDEYTYYIAGCVGEFWTQIMMDHVPSLAVAGWSINIHANLGIQFGKALQMTNILRDLPKDLRIGRCYLPEQLLQQHNLTPQMLLNGDYWAAQPLLFDQLRHTLNLYQAAGRYVFAIPRRCLRLRLAALWPVVIGLETLMLLVVNEQWLDPMCPSKVKRNKVYAMLFASVWMVFSHRLIGWWLQRYQRKILQHMETPDMK